MLSLFRSPHSTTIACILSLALSSTVPLDWINKPLITTFCTLLGGGIAGNIINDLPAPEFRPYVSGGILGLSLINACARYLGWIPPPKNTPIFYINIQSGNCNDSKNLLSYTTHNIGPKEPQVLPVDGTKSRLPTLIIDDLLTKDNIM